MKRYLEQQIDETDLGKPEQLDAFMMNQLADYLNIMGNYVMDKVIESNQDFEEIIKNSGGLQLVYEPEVNTSDFNMMLSIDGLELPQVNLTANDIDKDLSFLTIIGNKGSLDGVYCGDVDGKFNNLRGFGMQFSPEKKMIRISMGDKLVMPPLTDVADLIVRMVEKRISYIERSF